MSGNTPEPMIPVPLSVVRAIEEVLVNELPMAKVEVPVNALRQCFVHYQQQVQTTPTTE